MSYDYHHIWEIMVVLTGCTNTSDTAVSAGSDKIPQDTEIREDTSSEIADIKTDEDISDTTGENYENNEDGGHAILADGEEKSIDGATISKTGEAEGDEADFYGENSAVFATNGGKLTLTNMKITTDGTHANAVFSYGEGTEVNISNSDIETSGNCSGGIMTTGGGTMNASNLTIHTTGNSSAAIRSDRGGGTVTVNGGNYTTDGKGSPGHIFNCGYNGQ